MRAAFPPHFERIIPHPGQRDRMLASMVWSLLRANQTEEARRFLRAGGASVAFEGGVLGRRARARESFQTARASSTDPEQRTTLRQRGVDLLNAAIALAPNEPEAVLELADELFDQNRLEEIATLTGAAAARMPGDGRILALLGRALITLGRATEAEDAFRRATEATAPRAPAGTSMMRARALDSSEPRRPKEARDVLRADPSVLDDLVALRKLYELEIEVGAVSASGIPAAATAISARIAELEERQGRAQLDAALAGIPGRSASALDAAKEATALLPKDPVAWRVRGWLELRSRNPDAAVRSFRASLAHSTDRAADRARIVGWYRLVGRDPAELDAEGAK